MKMLIDKEWCKRMAKLEEGHEIGGVRMDHVRRCHCGRRPIVSTGYKQFELGFGPFVIFCGHGQGSIMEQYEAVQRGELDAERYVFCRSWSKTRVVANWRHMMANAATLTQKDQAA